MSQQSAATTRPCRRLVGSYYIHASAYKAPGACGKNNKPALGLEKSSETISYALIRPTMMCGVQCSPEEANIVSLMLVFRFCSQNNITKDGSSGISRYTGKFNSLLAKNSQVVSYVHHRNGSVTTSGVLRTFRMDTCDL